MTTKIYITYMVEEKGPYCVKFNTQQEAEEWIHDKDIRITAIDRIEEAT